MSLIVLYSFLITILFTPFGLFLSNENKKDLEYFSSQFLYGLIILSFIALFLNFFFPLSKLLNTLVLILPIIFLIKKRNIYLTRQFFIFLFFSTILILLLITESNVYRPDAGLYHLPYIKILNDEKIIFGLSNLHSRYGHISIIQYLSAISNNLIFRENGIIFAQALIASSVIINFVCKIFNYNKKKEYNFHFFFLISVLIFIIYKMNRYSEYGNDAPGHFLFFYLISELLIIKKNKIKDISNLFLIILFIFLNKVTLLLSSLFVLLLVKKKEITNFLKIKRFYFLIFFSILWFTKNIIISGCLIYPIKSTCFDNLIWSDIKTVENLSNENEAWTKDWPTYLKQMETIENDSVSVEKYSKKFFWVRYWSKGHLKKISNIMLPYLLFLFIIILFFKLQTKNNLKFSISKIQSYMILILIFSCLIWFIKVPVFRYGYSYLISLISLIFASICLRNFVYKNYSNKFFNIFLIFCLIIFSTKNMMRIVNTDNDYFNFPWPKYFAMDEKNVEYGVEEQSLNGKKFYKPIKYCMFSNSPCGSYGLKNNLDLILKHNYYVLYLK